MTLGKISMLAIGAALLAAPLASNAQSSYGQSSYGQSQYGQPYSGQNQYSQPYNGQNQYGQSGYDRRSYNGYDNGDRGDYGRRRSTYGSYPQFRGIEQHIRSEIQSGLREDQLEPDDARDLLNQLRQIQSQEAREFRVHGWNLPADDQARIREQLSQLDSTVDQTRQEQ